jgi:hypothetical protein
MVGNGKNPLDWTRSENQKLYHKAVEKLSLTFEGKSDQVILLGQALQNRGIQSGWNVHSWTSPIHTEQKGTSLRTMGAILTK